MKKLKTSVIIITIFVIGLFSNIGYAFADGETVEITGALAENGAEAFDSNGAGGQNVNRIKGVYGETGYCLDAGYTPIGDGEPMGGCTVTDITNEPFGQGLAQLFSDGNLNDAQLANYIRGLGTTDLGQGTARTDRMGEYTDSYFNLGKSDYMKNILSNIGKGNSSTGVGGILYDLKPGKNGDMKIVFNNLTGKDGTFKLSDLKGVILPDGVDPNNINIPAGLSSLLLKGDGSKTASGDCNQSFNGDINSPIKTPAGDKCSQVLLYKCPYDDVQQFVSCPKKDSTPEDNGETPINGGDPVKIDCPPEDDCPYDPEDFVDELNGDDGIPGVADALCDWGGSQKYITQESDITSNNYVDKCAPESYNEIKGYSDYCNLYCIEDYEFNVGSAGGTSPLKIDPDYEPITAGTYFNFDPQKIEIEDRVSASCYTVGHIDAMMADVLDEAKFEKEQACEGSSNGKNDYCKRTCKIKTTGPYCDCPKDKDGKCTCPEYYLYQKDIYIDYWYAQDNTKDFELEWQKKTGEFYKTVEGPSKTPLYCTGATDNIEYGTNKPNPNYQGIAAAADQHVKKYNDECTNIQEHVLEQMEDCAKKLTYTYYDGEILVATDGKSVTPREFESNANGEQKGSGKNCYNPQDTAYNTGAGTTKVTYEDCGKDAYNQDITIGDGKKTSTKLLATTTSGGSAEKGYVYTLEPPTIKNSYGINQRAYDFGDAEDKTLYVNTAYKGWPIAIDTPQGRYRYLFQLDSVKSCLKNDNNFNLPTEGGSDDINCVYDVNGCDSCVWWCDPDSRGGCSGEPRCLDCLYSCVGAGCIYDKAGGLAINYIPISLLNIDQTFNAYAFLGNKYNNVLAVTNAKNKLADKVAYLSGETDDSQMAGLPSNLSYSRNWSKEKGVTILQKYDTVGEEIYEESSSAYGLEYRFVLDPKTLKEIKNYNKEHEGYADNSDGHLYCYEGAKDVTIAEEGKAYIICESRFLDDVLKWSNNSKNVKAPKFASSKEAGVTSLPKGTNKETGPAFK